MRTGGLSRSGASADRRTFSVFIQMAALCRAAATTISRSKWAGGRGRLPRMPLIERTITVAAAGAGGAAD
jgi:hypothetical protein